MSAMPPLTSARLEALAQLCYAEFQFEPETELVIVAFDGDGQISGSLRLPKAVEPLSVEAVVLRIRAMETANVLVASLGRWPLTFPEQSLERLDWIDRLIEHCQARQIEMLDYLYLQGQSYQSMRVESDLWYALCA